MNLQETRCVLGSKATVLKHFVCFVSAQFPKTPKVVPSRLRRQEQYLLLLAVERSQKHTICQRVCPMPCQLVLYNKSSMCIAEVFSYYRSEKHCFSSTAPCAVSCEVASMEKSEIQLFVRRFDAVFAFDILHFRGILGMVLMNAVIKKPVFFARAVGTCDAFYPR